MGQSTFKEESNRLGKRKGEKRTRERERERERERKLYLEKLFTSEFAVIV